MPTIQPAYENAQTDANLNATSVTATPVAGAFVDLSAHDLCHCVVMADNQSVQPADDLIVEVYPSYDGGTSYATEPILALTVSKDTDPAEVHFTVRDVPGFRLSVYASGATDTIQVTHKYRRRNWTNV